MEPSLHELISLRDQVAVVTGGAAGVGRAVVLRLAEAGARVVVADLDGTAAEHVADAVGAADAVAYEVDVAREGSVAGLGEFVRDEFGRLDIWVNNAGIYPRDSLLDMSDERWRQVIDVNLSGTFYGSRTAARLMTRPGDGGVIVNVASLAAYRSAVANMTHYAASKAGVVGLTRSLAVELGPLGIRVVGVAPAFVPTENALALLELDGVQDAVERFAARAPLRRVVEPDDLARVVLFAVSGLAGMITGSTLPVDGGQMSG